MLAHGAKYQSERVSQTIPYLSVISYYLCATLPPSSSSMTKPTGLSKNSNFFIFQFFKKILSRGRSHDYPLPCLKVSARLVQPHWSLLITHNRIRLPFTHPLPKPTLKPYLILIYVEPTIRCKTGLN